MGYWSNISMTFFVILGFYTIWTVTALKRVEAQNVSHGNTSSSYTIVFVLVLTILSAYRYVGYGIGGTDTPSYIRFFENCNNPIYIASDSWYYHNDLLFRYFAKFIRFFTKDYHYYFIIIDAFIVYAYLLFLKEFCLKRSNYIPCLLLIFLYWRSMSSLRSNTAIAMMMISIVLVLHKRMKTAVAAATACLFIHKMSIVYFMFVPFYFYYKKRHVSKITMIIVMISIILLVSMAQSLFLEYTEDMDLGGSYQSYARNSINSSFWDNAWKIAFEQMMLGIFMWLYNGKINKHILQLDPQDSMRLKLVYIACVFDMLTIPINFTMGIWRGYEFFYLPRIVMWCEILYLANQGQVHSMKVFLNYLFLIAFISWMIFRFYHMWEDSGLMPYIFAPFFD